MRDFLLSVAVAAAASTLPSAAASAQSFQVTLVDGTTAEGRVVRVAGAGAEANLVLEAGAGPRSIPFARILGVHGQPPLPDREPSPALVLLVGGDRFEGEITGGDAGGESLTIASRSLGPVQVPLDRLIGVRFPRRPVAALDDDLRLPDGADEDEALLRPAARGFDLLLGEIERFTSRGVAFRWAQARGERTYTFDDLAGIALRGGVDRKTRPTARLVTRSGDVVGVDWVGADATHMAVRMESGEEVRVPWTDVAAVSLLGAPRRHLSDLPPTLIVEGEPAPGGGRLPPLYPVGFDRSSTGVFLATLGRCHAKGIGMHSSTSVTFRVPDGCTKFLTFVAIGDEPLAGDVRGDVDVRIRLDKQVLFEKRSLRAGQDVTRPGVLDVVPGRMLTLEVERGRGLFIGDRVHWLSPVFLP